MQINIPQRLKDLRKETGFTQQNVADGIKIKRTAYQAYEEGRAIPPMEALLSLAAFYGFFSLDHLLEINREEFQNIYLEKFIMAYHAADFEKRKIVDFILNLNC